MRRALLCVASLWLLAATAFAAPEILQVDVRRDGESVLVDAHADLPVSPRIAWDVLTDFDHYAQFIPDLVASQVVARSDDGLTVEQRGIAGLLFYRLNLDVRMHVIEEPFQLVRCTAVAGSFKQLEGVYRLVPQDAGVRFSYRGRVVPAFHLPPLIGTHVMSVSIERQLQGLVQEILRRAERSRTRGR